MNQRSSKHSWVFDKIKVEYEHGVTIVIALEKFETTKQYLTVIDAPGHCDFIKNMISIVLILDFVTSGFEVNVSKDVQAHGHTLLAFTL